MAERFYFKPSLTDSTFSFRIKLAEKRLSSYPLDSIDFLMMDLDQLKTRYRHASQCVTDLTGRTIEFLSAAHDIIPGSDEERLNAIYARMIGQGHMEDLSRRYMAYYKHTGNSEVFGLIKANYDRLADKYAADPDSVSGRDLGGFCDCQVEGLAELYAVTGDKKYIELAKFVAEKRLIPIDGGHSHSCMTVLRAMLKAGYLSGDRWFFDRVAPYREKLCKYQYADGSISEVTPKSDRNEGCSIADFAMINLRWYDITGESSALDRAEHTVLNALFFNQFVTGGFGHRSYLPSATGYGTEIEEAFWCCTQTGGMALCEFASHAVSYEKGAIRVLYPVPGVYTLAIDGKDARVTVTSDYPAGYSVNIRVENCDLPVEVRRPYYVKNFSISEHKSPTVPGGRIISVKGDIGHYAEERDGGFVIKYGPLLLAPMIYSTDSGMGFADSSSETVGVPEGYIPERLCGEFSVIEPAEKDENGFWTGVAMGDDRPEWIYFDDGVGSPTGTSLRAPAYFNVLFADGSERRLLFQPICYATSNLTLCPVPLVFGIVKKNG